MSDRIRPSDLPYAGSVPKGVGLCKNTNGDLLWDSGSSISAASGGSAISALPTVSYPNLLEPVDYYALQVTDFFKSKKDGNTYLLARCDDGSQLDSGGNACTNQRVYRVSKNSRTPGVAPSAPVLIKDFAADGLYVKQGPFYYPETGLMVVQTNNTAGGEVGTTPYQLHLSWDEGVTWIRHNIGARYSGDGNIVGTAQLLSKNSLATFKMPTTGQTAIIYGWYNTSGTANYKEIQLVISLDRGQTFKTLYAWNLTATGGTNDKIRHIHFVKYNKYTQCLYVGMGDGNNVNGVSLDANGVDYHDKQGMLEVDMALFSGFPATQDLYLTDPAFNSGAFKTLIGDQKYRSVDLQFTSDGLAYYGTDQISLITDKTLWSGFFRFGKGFADHTQLDGDLPEWYEECWYTTQADDSTLIFTSSPAINVERAATIGAVNTTTDEITFSFSSARNEIETGDLVWLTGAAAPAGAVLSSGVSVAYYWLIKTGTNTAKLAATPKHAEKGIAVNLTTAATGSTINFLDKREITIYASTDGTTVKKVGIHRTPATVTGISPQGIFVLDDELYLTATANAQKSTRATSVSRFSETAIGQAPIPVVHPVFFVNQAGTNVNSTEVLKGGYYPCMAVADAQFLLRVSPAAICDIGARVQLAAGTYTTARTTVRGYDMATSSPRQCIMGLPIQIAGAGKDLTIWEHDTAAVYHFLTQPRGAGSATGTNLELIGLHLNSAANAALTTERIIRAEAENHYIKCWMVRMGDKTGQFAHIQQQSINQLSLLNGCEILPHPTNTGALGVWCRSTTVGYALEIKGAVIASGYRSIVSSDATTGAVIWDFDHAALVGFSYRGIDITAALNLGTWSNVTNTIIATNVGGSNIAVSDSGSGFDWNDTQVNNNAIWTEFATKVSPASVASSTDATVANYAALQLVPGGKYTITNNATAVSLTNRPANLVSFGGELTVKNIGPF
jgi:hypothetical protein